MQDTRPRLWKEHILLVKAIEAPQVVVEVDGVRYRARCLYHHDNPAAPPLREGDTLIVTSEAPQFGMTPVERVTPQGDRDGCRYALYEYTALSHAPSYHPEDSKGKWAMERHHHYASSRMPLDEDLTALTDLTDAGERFFRETMERGARVIEVSALIQERRWRTQQLLHEMGHEGQQRQRIMSYVVITSRHPSLKSSGSPRLLQRSG
jgi:hypothetical protein